MFILSDLEKVFWDHENSPPAKYCGVDRYAKLISPTLNGSPNSRRISI